MDVPDLLVLQISQVLQAALFVLILFGLHSLYNNLITKMSIQMLSRSQEIIREVSDKQVESQMISTWFFLHVPK
jgi:hypothetical protein